MMVPELVEGLKNSALPFFPPSSHTKRRRVESFSLCALVQAQGPNMIDYNCRIKNI